jgi:hypothetical protein
MWKSRDKESDIEFESPGNHWLYRQHSDFIISSASFLAVDSWIDSSSFSAKFDLCNHPEADELSVWLSKQDSGSSELWKSSTHIFMTQVMNSKELIDVRK